MKKLVGLVFVFAILMFLTNRGVHRLAFEWALVNDVLGKVEDQHKVNLLVDYAPLPDYERALILQHCELFFKDYEVFFGAAASVPKDRKPGCQTLFRSQWSPGWNTDLAIYK